MTAVKGASGLRPTHRDAMNGEPERMGLEEKQVLRCAQDDNFFLRGCIPTSDGEAV
jgi:hypothetical protein